jgi:hypothetical protein
MRRFATIGRGGKKVARPAGLTLKTWYSLVRSQVLGDIVQCSIDAAKCFQNVPDDVKEETQYTDTRQKPNKTEEVGHRKIPPDGENAIRLTAFFEPIRPSERGSADFQPLGAVAREPV